MKANYTGRHRFSQLDKVDILGRNTASENFIKLAR